MLLFPEYSMKSPITFTGHGSKALSSKTGFSSADIYTWIPYDDVANGIMVAIGEDGKWSEATH